ncbi:MAG TPA: hypothetical protein VI094_00725 [Propionibacteriaceae bacterium]
MAVETVRVFAAFIDALVAPGAFATAGSVAATAERVMLRFVVGGIR